MRIQDSVALVTGANRGLGRAFVRELVARGARKIYAGVRDPDAVDRAVGVWPIRLDVTQPDDIARAAAELGDVTLLVNNAAISRGRALLAADAVEAARSELETNVIGPLALSRAFAPILARNGGGAIVNVLSALSWVNLPGAATYSVSKAAAWSVTNGLRGELRAQGTQVLALHVAYMDTDMAKHVKGDKARPEQVAIDTLAALEAGRTEILADATAQRLKQGLSAGYYLGES